MQLARRPVDSATVIVLALLKVESFALLLVLLFMLKSFSYRPVSKQKA
jgi:hypothetical protein